MTMLIPSSYWIIVGPRTGLAGSCGVNSSSALDRGCGLAPILFCHRDSNTSHSTHCFYSTRHNVELEFRRGSHLVESQAGGHDQVGHDPKNSFTFPLRIIFSCSFFKCRVILLAHSHIECRDWRLGISYGTEPRNAVFYCAKFSASLCRAG